MKENISPGHFYEDWKTQSPFIKRASAASILNVEGHFFEDGEVRGGWR
jgi:hypothetical protein